MFCILHCSAFWHGFTLPEESVEVAQHVDRLFEKKRVQSVEESMIESDMTAISKPEP
jgi:hypothetical protein